MTNEEFEQLLNWITELSDGSMAPDGRGYPIKITRLNLKQAMRKALYEFKKRGQSNG